MHTNDLVHRDLKTDNVVYSPSQNANDFNSLQLKLIDFGFAQKSQKGERDLSDFVGTPYYIAPEIVKEEEYGSACDIWSLGVLAYFSIAGEFPFLATTRKDLFDKIKKGTFYFSSNVWKGVSENCKDFIKKCLTVSQLERPSAAILLKHPWIQDKPESLQIKKDIQKSFTKKIENNLASFSKTSTFQWSIISYMN